MTARNESLLHYLRRLTPPAENDAGDAVLLDRFASQRDESAFTALLARHGPMVLAVCRRILRNSHDAEDAFQAVFLVLARKAGTLRRPEALSSWLYGTARHLASTARRTESRRHQREARYSVSAAASPGDLLDDLSARELLLALDEELARLPETYRLPLILCHLEGHTREETARLLGWTAGSVKGRLERGRKLLQSRLTRRGLTLGASLLAMENMASATISAALRQATVQRSLAFAAGSAESIAASVLSLAEAGVTSMTMAKAKVALALLLAMGLTVGVRALVQPKRTQDQPPVQPVSPPAPASLAPAEKQIAVDRYGDPLPPGALTRLGSIRLRHGGHVRSVAFAPDGKTLVSSGYDGRAFLWEVATGKRLRAFPLGSASESVAIDPKGEKVALATIPEGAVKLYDLATGKEAETFSGHRGGTEKIVFSPDGKLMASGGKDKRIRLWNMANVREIYSWPADRVYVPSLHFTPDGKSLAYVAEPPALWFRDVVTGVERQPPGPLASQRILSFCFTADGKTVITGSADGAGLLQLWDAASGKEIRTIARTQGDIGKILVAPDDRSVWTLAWNLRRQKQDLCQWDLAAGKQLLHLPHPPYTRRIQDLALSPDGKRLATGTYSHDVFLWDTTTGRNVSHFVGHRFLTTAAVFTADGKQLYTGGYDETIRHWSVVSGEQLRFFSTERNPGDHIYSLALRPDGKMLAIGVIRLKIPPMRPRCDVRLWDLTTGEERKPLHGHEDWVTAVAFSPDGKLLASRSEDQTIRLWDIATGKERKLLRCSESGAKGIAFSPDGLRVISALNKETIGFWDVETGRLTRRLLAGPSGGNGIPLLSRDGRMFVTGGGEQPLRVWEVASGKERCRIERPKVKIYVDAAFSPDCRILAWRDSDPPIKLWDLLAGNELGTLGEKTNLARVSHLTFSPDSRRLASTHSDGSVLIWDMMRLAPKTGKPPKISAKQLQELWNELGSADAAKAYGALQTLAAAPGQSVPLLRQLLPKTARADAAKIAALLADLDSEQFEVRERANRSLQELGMSAGAAMRRALHKQPSLEVRRRLEQILEKVESGERKAEELRTLRAIELLELVGTSEAQQLLRERSQGTADDWLTQEAKASLARLAARSAIRP